VRSVYQGRRDADLEIGETAGLEICATSSIQTGKGHPKFSNVEGRGIGGKGMKAAGFVSQFPCRPFRCRFPPGCAARPRWLGANERFGRSAVQSGRLDVPYPRSETKLGMLTLCRVRARLILKAGFPNPAFQVSSVRVSPAVAFAASAICNLASAIKRRVEGGRPASPRPVRPPQLATAETPRDSLHQRPC